MRPVAARTKTSASMPRPAPTTSLTVRSCACTCRGGRARCLVRRRSGRGACPPEPVHKRPSAMPTPAAPKPQCQPTRSPRMPVTSWPTKAPVDAHVEDREAGVATRAAFGIQVTDDGGDVRLEQAGAEHDQHEAEEEEDLAGGPTAKPDRPMDRWPAVMSTAPMKIARRRPSNRSAIQPPGARRRTRARRRCPRWPTPANARSRSRPRPARRP
jgi:hypothetical protein